MPTPYDEPADNELPSGSCPSCGQALPNGVTVEREPMFEVDSPARYFFCAYCGLPRFASEFDVAPREEQK